MCSGATCGAGAGAQRAGLARPRRDQRGLDGGHDLRDVERLDQVGHRAQRLHLRDGVVVGEGGQEHERRLQRLAQVGGDVEAAHALHADVQQRQVGPVLARQQDRVVAVVGVDDLVAGLGQAVRDRRQHQAVVVDDEDLALAHRERLGRVAPGEAVPRLTVGER